MNGVGPEGLFVPRMTFVPDGAVGYAWFSEPPPDNVGYDGYGDMVAVCMDFGDGWYWMTGVANAAESRTSRQPGCS
jgi:hypothetical protein